MTKIIPKNSIIIKKFTNIRKVTVQS